MTRSILLSFPRSGSHLLAHILKAKPFTSMRPHGEYKPVAEVVDRLRRPGSFWFHYPYSDEAAQALAVAEGQRYLLLRDPRDIICSIAKRVAARVDTGIDYRHDGLLLSERPLQERIDVLIRIMGDRFRRYEAWRTSGLFFVLRYRDLVYRPAAESYKVFKKMGVVGSHRRIMTPDQIRRANTEFDALIGAW